MKKHDSDLNRYIESDKGPKRFMQGDARCACCGREATSWRRVGRTGNRRATVCGSSHCRNAVDSADMSRINPEAVRSELVVVNH